MELKAIQIDLETYKALESLRESFTESHSDIVRRVVAKVTGLARSHAAVNRAGGLMIRDGVFLRAGTKLRHIAKRTDDRYEAVVEDGGIRFNGKIYHSPSNAAVAAAGNSRNGWIFWEYFDEQNKQWSLLDSLRQ
ncbi:MAG TPA: hypothetical protein VIM41_15330 [Gammaproteobacteria bacterium]